MKARVKNRKQKGLPKMFLASKKIFKWAKIMTENSKKAALETKMSSACSIHSKVLLLWVKDRFVVSFTRFVPLLRKCLNGPVRVFPSQTKCMSANHKTLIGSKSTWLLNYCIRWRRDFSANSHARLRCLR